MCTREAALHLDALLFLTLVLLAQTCQLALMRGCLHLLSHLHDFLQQVHVLHGVLAAKIAKCSVQLQLSRRLWPRQRTLGAAAQTPHMQQASTLPARASSRTRYRARLRGDLSTA